MKRNACKFVGSPESRILRFYHKKPSKHDDGLHGTVEQECFKTDLKIRLTLRSPCSLRQFFSLLLIASAWLYAGSTKPRNYFSNSFFIRSITSGG